MFNSVFKRLTFIYFIVILLSFAILAMSLVTILGDYYFDQRREALIEEGQKLNKTVIAYLNREVSYERLVLELDSIERFLNAKIWVVDRKGYVYGVSSESEKKWIGKQLSTNDVINVLKGKIVTKEGEYDEVFGTPVLTVGIPIFVNGEVVNGVFMHSPIYEIQETLNELYRIVFVSMTISLLVALVLLYFASQRISRPLGEISKTAKIIASGEFQKRVSIDSRDEIGQLAKAFNYMAEELEKLEDTRREFIANVSHELRSPMTLIKGYVKSIRNMELTEDKQRQYIDIIYEETDKMTDLINNLLDLSRMEAGNYPLNITTFEVNELIRRAIIKFEKALSDRDIEVVVDFREDPIFVVGDRDSISQVVSNLIDNGLKFMDKGGVLKLIVKIKGEKAHISIEDNGPGIPKDELDNIWKRFYKGDKSRSRKVTGTGLGLSIVKEILKAHGENIWVDSEIQKGTKFTFTLSLNKN